MPAIICLFVRISFFALGSMWDGMGTKIYILSYLLQCYMMCLWASHTNDIHHNTFNEYKW